MDSKLIFGVIGVIAMVFGGSQAITCYICDSVNDIKCQDPFKSDGVATCPGRNCAKHKATVSGVTTVVRGCYDDPIESYECADDEAGVKSKVCFCRTDYCNDRQTVKPALYNVIIGVAMTTIAAIGWMNKI